jgi:hypothetical protein
MQCAHLLKAAASLGQTNAATAKQFGNPRKIKNISREKQEKKRDRADLPKWRSAQPAGSR